MVQNNSGSESFESLLNESLMRQDSFSVGDEVSGKVVQLAGDSVFVDISGKSEAIMERGELADKNGNLTVKVGDTIKAYVVAMRGGEIRLTSRIGKGHANLDLIEKAKEFNIPVEGSVITIVKGGFRVSVSGIECFCPLSQMDIKSVSQPESLLHKSFAFKVTQITEHGRNIVLSRRQLLEERQREREQELRATLKEGELITGTVSSIQKFGVFLNLDGMDALIPRTEISWSRNADPAHFAVGQTLTVKVISIDWDSKKFVLSLKQATQEPWERIVNYSVGQQVTGRITNIIKSGAFFELEPGLEGFIPVSRMSLTRRVNRPEDVVSIGANATVNIVEINREARKISLELVTGETDPWQALEGSAPDSIHMATIESVRPNGLFVRLDNGMSGYIPREECAVKKGTDLQTVYTTGKEIKIAVKSIDRENKKLKGSELDAIRKEERQDYERFMSDSSAPSGGQGSSFGMLFKQKFEEINKKSGS